MDQPNTAAGPRAGANEARSAETRQNTNTSQRRNILEVMEGPGKFTTFLAGIKAAELTERLTGSGSYTVFAPTDEAFRKLPAGAIDTLMKDKGKLKAVLNYHVVSGHLEAKHVKAGDLMTLQGSSLKVETSAQELRVNGARVTQVDMVASNGVVHVIDTVILPANWQLLAAAA